MEQSITSANSTIIGSVANLLPPTQILGYAADDIFTADSIDNAETMMGLDGRLSAGWIPVVVRVSVNLMADSPSMPFFETWYATEQQVQDKYPGSFVFTIPSISRIYTGSICFLRNYQPLANAAKVLQPRAFTLEFQSLVAASF